MQGRPNWRQGGGGNAVHAGAGLGDDPRLAHAPGQHDLTQHIVDLVRAGVIELLALEIDFRAAAMLGEPLGEIKRGLACRHRSRDGRPFPFGISVGLGLVVGLLELEDERHQRLGDEAAAIETEMTALVRAGAIELRAVSVIVLMRLWPGSFPMTSLLSLPLNAADFGVPQVRERVFVVADRDGRSFAFPKPTHRSLELETDLLGGEPSRITRHGMRSLTSSLKITKTYNLKASGRTCCPPFQKVVTIYITPIAVQACHCSAGGDGIGRFY